MDDASLVGVAIAHYELTAVIGQGRLGTVYRGHDTVLDRPVAVKAFSSALDPVRGLAAARRIARWRHPHIIRLHYVAVISEQVYLVMDAIDGQHLGALLGAYAADGMRMPHEHVLLIGVALARALDYAHADGVIHRMVDPHQVLIGANDAIVLTDFSLALDVQRGTTGQVFGTTPYHAPELITHSSTAGPAADQYALGAILYELLTGQPPRPPTTTLDDALAQLATPPLLPTRLVPALPAAVDGVLAQALASDPADRFPSCLALLDALTLALTPAPAIVLPSSRPAVFRRSDGGDAADPLIGARLGSYHVEALLGQGGMARIYRGRDRTLRRTVAIKVIDLPYQADPAYLDRFEREAQIIAQLNHPNIVQLYAYDDLDGLLYMAMQYVDGPDLQTQIRERRQTGQAWTAAEVLLLMRNIGFALDHAHQQGMIHRDVHPGNILRDSRGRALLTDFGLGLMTAVGTRGEIFGTAAYMAPEQARSSAAVVPQSDLYALGVILYELLTGQVPFAARTPLEVAMCHLTEAPPPPRTLNPALTPAVEAVLLRALAKDPADRYPTGATLAQALAIATTAGGDHG
jgi:serine/threonine protein kinase